MWTGIDGSSALVTLAQASDTGELSCSVSKSPSMPPMVLEFVKTLCTGLSLIDFVVNIL